MVIFLWFSYGFPIVLFNYQRVNPIKSHETTIKPPFFNGFLWFSYGFPMVFQRLPPVFPRNIQAQLVANDAEAFDRFGGAVGIDGGTVPRRAARAARAQRGAVDVLGGCEGAKWREDSMRKP